MRRQRFLLVYKWVFGDLLTRKYPPKGCAYSISISGGFLDRPYEDKTLSQADCGLLLGCRQAFSHSGNEQIITRRLLNLLSITKKPFLLWRAPSVILKWSLGRILIIRLLAIDEVLDIGEGDQGSYAEDYKKDVD